MYCIYYILCILHKNLSMISCGCLNIFADNFAVGYFRKQGFTSRISLPRDRWLG